MFGFGKERPSNNEPRVVEISAQRRNEIARGVFGDGFIVGLTPILGRRGELERYNRALQDEAMKIVREEDIKEAKEKWLRRLKRLAIVGSIVGGGYYAHNKIASPNHIDDVSSPSSKVAAEVFVGNSELERVDPNIMNGVKEDSEDLREKLNGQDGEVFRINDDYYGVVVNDSTIRVFHQKPDYDLVRMGPHGGLKTDAPEMNSPEGIDTEQGKNYAYVGTVNGDTWQSKIIEETPSNTFDLTVGENMTTLEWGATNSRPGDDKEERIDALGRMQVDNNTGGILEFVDADNPKTSFHLREDGFMVLGEDEKGPEYAKAFFEMKAEQLREVREEVDRHIR